MGGSWPSALEICSVKKVELEGTLGTSSLVIVQVRKLRPGESSARLRLIRPSPSFLLSFTLPSASAQPASGPRASPRVGSPDCFFSWPLSQGLEGGGR